MYSPLQKLLSALLLIISICLVSLSLWSNLAALLSQSAPFQQITSSPAPSETTYPASALGVSTARVSTPSSLYAKAYCLLDADSGRVLFGKESDQKLPMASTTKIMTCIIALENADLKDTVTFSSHAASMPDVQLNASSGETFRLIDLLHSLMLESHNDTAVAIAEHVGGSVEGFADLMNRKAEELGCTRTHFVTPNGLDAKEHYTTARELCLIARYAIQNKRFLKIIQTPNYSFSNTKGTRTFAIRNHDAFLTGYNGAIGIKTGFTGNAGYCFCGAARRNGKTLITSVLACGWPPHKSYKWSDTKKLMDYGFTAFASAELPSEEPLPSLPVVKGQVSSIQLQRNQQTLPSSLLLKADDKIRICYDLPESLTAPVRSGDIIGYENYYLNDTLFESVPVITTQTAKEADLPYLTRLLLSLYFCTSTSV